MADGYIHSTGSGTSPYDTWAKAANNATQTQAVLDAAVAGETIHAAGTITLAASLDIDVNSGDLTDGLIKLIGYNSSHVNDGTRFIIDGNDAAVNCIDRDGPDFWWLENIELKNATGNGSETGSNACINWTFINCCANNNGSFGFDGYNGPGIQYFQCVAYSNTSDGWGAIHTGTRFMFCRSRDNGQSGFDDIYSAANVYIGCIADHNGNDGIENLNKHSLLFNCVIDDNTDDGILIYNASTDYVSVIGCRITNHSVAGEIGLNASDKLCLHGWNYYQDNDGNNIQNDAFAYEIPDDGAGTDVEDQGDAESGYTDEDDPEDYNLTDAATSRRTAIQIPLS